ncbi:hypothetical protein RI065_04375 [Mycoplasmatota bacterium zrk1]
MKKIIIILGCFSIMSLSSGCSSESTIDYYDLNVPESAPIIFGEGTVSSELIHDFPPTFNSKMDEMYFSRLYRDHRHVLCKSIKVDGIWQEIEEVSFTGKNEQNPVFSSDGKILFFAADSEPALHKPSEIYKIDISSTSDAIMLDNNVNSNSIEYHASSSDNGNLYFSREGEGLFVSTYDGSNYSNAALLEEFSDYTFATNPFIAKDESFILFDSRANIGEGAADIYISFKYEDGFGEPINLGTEINTSAWEGMATLSPDYKYLFFAREGVGERDIYWVEFNVQDYR